jgi:hypothetical protein
MACQKAFSQIMNKTEGKMINTTEMENEAIVSCLKPLGDYVSTIGMQRPLADFSRQEVLTLIEVAVTAFQAHMLSEHERMASSDRAFLEQRLARQTQLLSTGRTA